MKETNRTFDGKVSSAINPIIPKGFEPVDLGGVNWGEKDSWENGLVVVDATGNEYVWIPEFNFNFFKNGKNDIKEKLCMHSSVKMNGGFYLGRYDAGRIEGTRTPVSQKRVEVWNNIPWGERNSDTDPGNGAVSLARSVYPKEDENLAVVSTLIYEEQWNSVQRFIEKTAGKQQLQLNDRIDSGNYRTYYGGMNDLQITGSSEKWKTKNIYDFWGNIWEWTMASLSQNSRVGVSGSFFDLPEYIKSNFNFKVVSPAVGFRIALYIK